jgi:hypothetical protein
LDGIASAGLSAGYWQVWPAVFMTEQLHYESGYKGPNVFGVTVRGAARRSEFQARLAAQGRIKLACIDLTPSDCAAEASSEMGVNGADFNEIAPMEQLQDNHLLRFVEISSEALAK